MHFGATLRLLRANAGFTLRDLADRLGVSNAYLSRVENGHDRPPTPDRLAELATALGLPRTKLIELADRVVPDTQAYGVRVPVARELFLDIARRELGPLDVARIRAFVEREFPLPARANAARAVLRMMSPERVVLRLACEHFDDVIDVAAAKLAGEAAIGDTIRANERSCSSAVGGGLALPYALLPNATPTAVLVTLRRPLAMSTPDGQPLRFVIVQVHPGPPEHTTILAQLAQLADEEVATAIVQARDAVAAIAVVRDAFA